jgi:hypothetical protein
MNANLIFELALAMARNEIRKHGKDALSATERALTLSQKDLNKLTKGMSAEDAAKARALTINAADAMSDALVFLASCGEIDPD